MRVRFSPRSEADLEDIADYIARDNPRRAIAFIARLRKRALDIGGRAVGYAILGFGPPGTRRAWLGRYPIYFTVESDSVRIERILHGARDQLALLDEN